MLTRRILATKPKWINIKTIFKALKISYGRARLSEMMFNIILWFHRTNCKSKSMKWWTSWLCPMSKQSQKRLSEGWSRWLINRTLKGMLRTTHSYTRLWLGLSINHLMSLTQQYLLWNSLWFHKSCSCTFLLFLSTTSNKSKFTERCIRTGRTFYRNSSLTQTINLDARTFQGL
jgi:hypothetical protein